MKPKLITTSPEAAPDYQNIGEVMSNFDHAIDEKVFKCQVKRHRVHVATAMSDELRKIMTVISDEYGWD